MKLRQPKVEPYVSDPRFTLSDVVEVAGFGCLVAAAWLWHPLVGLVALGAALVYVAQAL